MYARVEIAVRWSLAVGLLGWGLVRTMIVPFGWPLLVFAGAVIAGPFLVGTARARLRVRPRDLSVLRRELVDVARVLALVVAVLVAGLTLEAAGARPAGALLTGVGLAALCAAMASTVCRLWRGAAAP